ncbi:White-opaque regulator 1 [Candida viswanathii]|uniref:White-opaque regulator 1 n=1 Tax=Candida viswanathii TaxID=5486 RepID=A0A367YCU2_9ASCO|nr:White-opaque regulator 1 [Candida viswanathii]
MSASKLTPTYHGYIHSTRDALLVIQEVLDKQLEPVMRRPHERERSLIIKSGAVFVFIEQQSGIKRWTDGISWSPSRIQGRFLVYGELDKKSLTDKDSKKKKKRKFALDDDDVNDNGHNSNNLQLHNSKSIRLNSMILPSGNDPTSLGHPQHQPQHSTIPVASIPSNVIPASSAFGGSNDYRNSLVNGPLVSACILQNGLVKKTITLTTTTKDLHIEKQEGKQTIHLISYYAKQDIDSGKLQRPSESDLKNVQIVPNLWTAAQESSLGGKTPIEDEEYYGLDPTIQQSSSAGSLGGAPGAANTKSYANYSKNIARVYNNKYSGGAGPGDDNNSSQEVPFINPFPQHSSSTNPYGGQTYAPNPSATAYNGHQQPLNSSTNTPQQIPLQQQIGIQQQQHVPPQQQQQYGQYAQYGSIPPQATSSSTGSNANGPQQQGPPPDMYGGQYAGFLPPPPSSVYGPIYQYHMNNSSSNAAGAGASSTGDQYGMVGGGSSLYHGNSSTPNNSIAPPPSSTNNNNNNNGGASSTTASTATANNRKFSNPSSNYGYANNNGSNSNVARTSTGSNATTGSTSSISGPSNMMTAGGSNSWFANNNGGYITSSASGGPVGMNGSANTNDYDNGSSSSGGVHNLPSFNNGVSGLQPQGQVIPSLVSGNPGAGAASAHHHHHHPHHHHPYSASGAVGAAGIHGNGAAATAAGVSVTTGAVAASDDAAGGNAAGSYYTTAN